MDTSPIKEERQTVAVHALVLSLVLFSHFCKNCETDYCVVPGVVYVFFTVDVGVNIS